MTIDRFLEIEEKYRANSLHYKGFYYWTYHRLYLYDTYIFGKRDKTIKDNLLVYDSRWIELRNRINSINTVRKRSVKLEHKDVLVLNLSRKIMVEEEYECIYTSELVETFSNYITLEYPYEGGHFWPARDKNIKYLDSMVFNSIIYYKIRSCSFEYRRCKEYIIKCITPIINEVCHSFQIMINIEALATRMADSYFRYRYEKRAMKYYVNRVKPSVIIEVDAGSWQAMILNEVAKEQGIKTIELQHGTMGKNHVSYNYPTGVNISQFPDYIFSFFNSMMNSARIPIPRERIIPTGYPYLERLIKKYPKKKNNDRIIKVVFVSQQSIGLKLSELAVKMFKRLDKASFNITYVLHPKEYNNWEKRYNELKKSAISVVGDSTKSIYEYLACADVVIGVGSTALIEGLVYNPRTFVYDIEGSESLLEFVDAGYMKLFSDENELMDLLRQYSQDNILEQEQLWKVNAIQNMKYEITKITGRSDFWR